MDNLLSRQYSTRAQWGAMFNTCSICCELWLNFADATTEHVLAENRLEMALLDCDTQAFISLSQQAASAFERKAKLREAIRKHETDAHGALARGF